MNKRNNNFAAVLAYLKERGDINHQKELAQRMGVSEDTISRILKGGRVSETTITKLHAATDGLFNLQWLRGQSDVMLSAEAIAQQQASPTLPDATATILAAKDETIAALRSQLSDKDTIIESKDAQLADKERLILTLQQQLSDLRMQAAIEKGLQEAGGSFRSEAAELHAPQQYDHTK